MTMPRVSFERLFLFRCLAEAAEEIKKHKEKEKLLGQSIGAEAVTALLTLF